MGIEMWGARNPGGALRVEIDGRWSVEEMGRELAALDYFYNVACIAAPPPVEFIAGDNDEFVNFSRGTPSTAWTGPSLLTPRSPYKRAVTHYLTTGEWTAPLQIAIPQRCQVGRISYGSPGKQDFFGIGSGLEVLADLLKYFLEWKQRRERHDAEMQMSKLQRERVAIENARSRLAFMQEAKFAARDIQRSALQWASYERIVSGLIEDGKITGVKFHLD